jgi:hypothetical protein
MRGESSRRVSTAAGAECACRAGRISGQEQATWTSGRSRPFERPSAIHAVSQKAKGQKLPGGMQMMKKLKIKYSDPC